MKINDRSRRRRAGFTLVELLVVIAIIAVLVSLVAAAVMKLMGLGAETKRRSDISQMQAALAQAKAYYKLDQQLPSLLVIDESGLYIPPPGSTQATIQLYQDSQALLMRMFKLTSAKQLQGLAPNYTGGLDWNANTKIDPPTILTGDQCLVFFLGGMIYGSPVPGPQGFCTVTGQATSMDPNLPRSQPFFNFDNSRLLYNTANGFYSYLDPYCSRAATHAYTPTPGQTPPDKPYLYFSSYKRSNGYNRYGTSDCANWGVAPYIKSVNGTVNTYWNERSFQIISAGPDKTFGAGGVGPLGPWGPSAPAQGAGNDDMSNFAEKILGSGQ